jgi:hypothetical protein
MHRCFVIGIEFRLYFTSEISSRVNEIGEISVVRRCRNESESLIEKGKEFRWNINVT